jgi:hypothetical protein
MKDFNLGNGFVAARGGVQKLLTAKVAERIGKGREGWSFRAGLFLVDRFLLYISVLENP